MAGVLNAALIHATALPGATATVLKVSPSGPVAAGTLVTVTASVSSAGNAISPGLVLFCDASAPSCTDIHVLGQAQLTSAGAGIIKLILPIGTLKIKAVFQGTNLFSPSHSAIQAITVSPEPYPTVTAIAASGTAGNYILTGTVTSSSAALSGTVKFIDASNGNQAAAEALLGPTALNFIFQTPTLPSGDVPEAAGDFNGDGNQDQAAIVNGKIAILLGHGDGTFSMKATFSAGSAPSFIAVADFNGDDIPDLAVTNRDDGTVSTFLGRGDGTFVAAGLTSTVVFPFQAAVGDFNGDGNADLVVVSEESGTQIMLGHGDGTFTPLTALESNGPVQVIVGDFNGDGKADLAVANGNVAILFGNGDGTFAAASGLDVPCTASCNSVVAADFNGDGNIDLAITDIGEIDNFTGNVFIYLGDGRGGFTEGSSFGEEFFDRIQSGDFNGDGVADIVTGEPDNPAISVFFGVGDGTFTGEVDLFTSIGSFYNYLAADFNNDGLTDLIAGDAEVIALFEEQASATASGVSITGGSPGIHNIFATYEGNDSFLASSSSSVPLQAGKIITTVALQISAQSVTRGETVRMVATVSPSSADSDTASGIVTFYTGTTVLGTRTISDGTASLSTRNFPVGDQNLTAAYGGDTNFSPGVSPSVKLVAANIRPNATTTTLVVTPSHQASAGALITLIATVSFEGHAVVPAEILFCDASAVRCVDDAILGRSEVTEDGEATFHWLPGIGSYAVKAFFPGANSYAASASSVEALTVNARYPTTTTLFFSFLKDVMISRVTSKGNLMPTGTVSIVPANLGNDALASASLHSRSTNFALTQSAPIGLTNQPQNMALGDLNGDGIPDLVTTGSNGIITVLLGQGDGTFVSKSTLVAGSFGWSVAIGDLNGDGIPDIVAGEDDPDGNHVFVFLGKGDGRFAKKSAPGTASFPQAVAIADLNGDGIPDLVVRNFSGPDFYSSMDILLGNGDGTFTRQTLRTHLEDESNSIVVADFNGDGIPDLAFPNLVSKSVSVLLGKGDGTFGKSSQYPAGFNSNSLVTGDFNGDGIPDLAATGIRVDGDGNYLNGEVSIFLGKRDGTFTAASNLNVGNAYFPNSVTVGDFNGDGILDLAANTINFEGPGRIALLLGKGDGTFTPTFLNDNGGFPMLVGDLNGDGSLDLIGANRGGSQVNVLLGDLSVTATATIPELSTPNGGPYLVRARYDGDDYHNPSVSPTIAVPTH